MTPRDYLAGVAADIVPAEDRDGELDAARAVRPAPLLRLRGVRGLGERERATTPNGVFGAKIMWPYMAGLVDGLSTIPRHQGTVAPNDLLAQAFPGLRYVWLRRMDKVRQAVSLWRAIQTWHWRMDAARRTRASEAARRAVAIQLRGDRPPAPAAHLLRPGVGDLLRGDRGRAADAHLRGLHTGPARDGDLDTATRGRDVSGRCATTACRARPARPTSSRSSG